MQLSGQKRPAKKELWFQCGRYFARTVRREDASERWAQWLNDPWVVEALNLAPRVLNKDDIAGYIKQSDQRTHLMLGIFERGTRVHVGIIRIDLDYAAREALVNAIIGEPEHRNRGATTDAFVSTLDFLFDKKPWRGCAPRCWRATTSLCNICSRWAGSSMTPPPARSNRARTDRCWM